MPLYNIQCTSSPHPSNVSKRIAENYYLFQHDAQLDYYGTKLATCSSDKTIKIFDVKDGQQTLINELQG